MCYLDEYSDEQFLINFDRINQKGAYGKADDGHDVYVDSFSGVNVHRGESWYCNLIRKENGFNHYYFANPVHMVDKGNPVQDTRSSSTVSIPNTSGSMMDSMPEDICADRIIDAACRPEQFGFVAIGDDTIYSPRLNAARYSVYRSLNGEHFEIIPDAKGDIPCINNSIALDSLDDVLDCEFPIRLYHEVHEDRILLKLTE